MTCPPKHPNRPPGALSSKPKKVKAGRRVRALPCSRFSFRPGSASPVSLLPRVCCVGHSLPSGGDDWALSTAPRAGESCRLPLGTRGALSWKRAAAMRPKLWQGRQGRARVRGAELPGAPGHHGCGPMVVVPRAPHQDSGPAPSPPHALGRQHCPVSSGGEGRGSLPWGVRGPEGSEGPGRLVCLEPGPGVRSLSRRSRLPGGGGHCGPDRGGARGSLRRPFQLWAAVHQVWRTAWSQPGSGGSDRQLLSPPSCSAQTWDLPREVGPLCTEGAGPQKCPGLTLCQPGVAGGGTRGESAWPLASAVCANPSSRA